MCQACKYARFKKNGQLGMRKVRGTRKKKSVKLLRGKNPSNCLVCGENRNETRKEEAAVKSWPESCLSVTQPVFSRQRNNGERFPGFFIDKKLIYRLFYFY